MSEEAEEQKFLTLSLISLLFHLVSCDNKIFVCFRNKNYFSDKLLIYNVSVFLHFLCVKSYCYLFHVYKLTNSFSFNQRKNGTTLLVSSEKRCFKQKNLLKGKKCIKWNEKLIISVKINILSDNL